MELMLPGTYTHVVGPGPGMSPGLWQSFIDALVPGTRYQLVPGTRWTASSHCAWWDCSFLSKNCCIVPLPAFFAPVYLLPFAMQDVFPQPHRLIVGFVFYCDILDGGLVRIDCCFSSSFVFSLTALIVDFIFFCTRMATVETALEHKEVAALKHQEVATPGPPGGTPRGEVVEIPGGNVIMTPVGIVVVVGTPEGRGRGRQVNGSFFLCLMIRHFSPPFPPSFAQVDFCFGFY